MFTLPMYAVRKGWRATAALACVAVAMAACTADSTEREQVTLRYTLWVDTQLPAYQACADAFHQQNPSITVKITQTAWGQYWTDLTTQVVSGDAPDVFANSVAYYPQFVENNQILDIQPFVTRDNIDLSQYQAGLTDLWVRDQKRYGLPKDWDAIALIHNTELVKQAGVDLATLQTLTWDPTDGGSFEDLIARLTVDANGTRGDQPGFDKDNVKTYGIVVDLASGSLGQTSWGNFAVMNGWYYTDKNPWGTHFNYSDPRFTDTIAWFASLQSKGFMARYEQQSSLTSDAMLESDKAAIGITGSWMAGHYLGESVQNDYAFAPLPQGPTGRKSALNGLSDAIWAGTKHPDQAWEWVKFLASPACQNIVASHAVVFPAIKESTQLALAEFAKKGRDVSVFVNQASAPDGTFILPITENSGDIATIIQTAMDEVWLGRTDASTALTKANDQVNGLFR